MTPVLWSPIVWTYDQADPALMLWTASVQRFSLTWPCARPRVLELGCAETDWLERMSRQNPGATFIGVDVHEQRRDFPTRVGSAIDPDLFEPESFDAIVMLGALEHFGMGFYGDPVDDDGDTKTMRNVARWLRPGGWVYFDVPCQPTFGIRPNRHFRDYAPSSIGERLIVSGLKERCRGYSECEPLAGQWVEEPTVAKVPYWFVAVVADKESSCLHLDTGSTRFARGGLPRISRSRNSPAARVSATR